MPAGIGKLPVPRKKAQEWVSVYFIRALCAQASLNYWVHEWDDGIDLVVGCTKCGFAGVSSANINFCLQVKSTKNWSIQNGNIPFWLDRQHYERLAADSNIPVYLILYTLPADRREWIRTADAYAALQHCAYFLDCRRLKPLAPAAAGKTVYVPVANRLSAGELLGMYRDAAGPWRKS